MSRQLRIEVAELQMVAMQFSEQTNILSAGTVERVRLQIQPGDTLEEITASYRIDRGGGSFEREIPLRPYRPRYPIVMRPEYCGLTVQFEGS